MTKQFERDGIHFQYPDNWQLESEETDGGWNVSLQSPETAFMVLSVHPEEDDPSNLADETLTAMRASFPNLEARTAIETIAGQPAIGHDIDFFAFDLTNSCWTRCLQGPEGCILLMCQCTDDELPDNGPVLNAVTQSLLLDDSADEEESS